MWVIVLSVPHSRDGPDLFCSQLKSRRISVAAYRIPGLFFLTQKVCSVKQVNGQAQDYTQPIGGMRLHLLKLSRLPTHGRNNPSASIPMTLWILRFQAQPFAQRCSDPRSNQRMPGMLAGGAPRVPHICIKYRAECTHVHMQVCGYTCTCMYEKTCIM